MEIYLVSKHPVPIIVEFCREKSLILQPWQKDMVTFPEVELGQLNVLHPFQPALRRGLGQLAGKFRCCEDEDIPVIAFEIGEEQ